MDDLMDPAMAKGAKARPGTGRTQLLHGAQIWVL